MAYTLSLLFLSLFVIQGIQAQTNGYVMIFCFPPTTGVFGNQNKSVIISCQVEVRGRPWDVPMIRGTVCKVSGGGCLPNNCNIPNEGEIDQWKFFCSFTVPAYTPPGEYLINIDPLESSSYPSGNPFTILPPPATYPPCTSGWGVISGSQCELCPKGTYANSDACTVCPVGTTGKQPGKTSCSACPPGFYGPGGSAACISAVAGWYAPGGTARSFACEAGTYSGAGASSCIPCPAGKYSSCTASSSCTNCPAGKVTNSTGNYVCIPCLPGTYASTTGMTQCTPCPANTYSSALASTSCSSCPSGKSTVACSHSALCCI
jgi:hypothetical protein